MRTPKKKGSPKHNSLPEKPFVSSTRMGKKSIVEITLTIRANKNMRSDCIIMLLWQYDPILVDKRPTYDTVLQ